MTKPDTDNSTSDTEERLIRIESALAHLQHDIEQLNASLTNHYGRMVVFEERFSRIEHEIESLSDDNGDRTLQDEKPPHY
ncbi:SlyX family protein [Fuerstiella marisgermanici]|uniref:SlyX protein n=1 Tax=Fuerstiella marisgermanici TaxID=1891926 RepID=A0A1P8WM50_9PLAN|nr:SlyX family protein [Fuerstiella marisgermanici]APZ95126.1 hypothetical protein Fuma_04780 [Fuerstiella marisgermanici]